MKDEYLIEMCDAYKGNDVLDYSDEEIDFYVACYDAYMANVRRKQRQATMCQEENDDEGC